VVIKGKYPYLVLQEEPVKIMIPVHQLVAYLTQGPSPTASTISSSHQATAEQQEDMFLELVSAQVEQQQQQQQQPSVVVCHRDLPSMEGSRLQWTGNVEADDILPHPSVCLSKRCSNPKHLFYSTQPDNAMTGKHHRVQQHKCTRKFCGGSCPTGCVKCDRLSKAHKKQL
jgi:hypothetical protein